jgi:hypothetical protein
MDLIRHILLEIENSENDPGDWIDISPGTWLPETVSAHVKLLCDARLIEAQDLSDLSASDWRPTALTWAGHDFLDAARNATVYNAVSKRVKESAISMSLEGFKNLLQQAGQQVVKHGVDWISKSDWSWLQIPPLS